MKHITNNSARRQGKRELRALLQSLRFVDGLTIEQEDTKVSPDDFVYYYNKARDGMQGNYIVYEIIASDPSRRADDKIIGREFYAQIDVFCTKSFESKLLIETLTKLEERLTAAGFEIDLRHEDYEPTARLYHQAIYITKQYF